MIRSLVLAGAERRLRKTCDSLPAEVGDDCYREWAAELPAILDDSDVHPALLRWICVWLFVLDQSRTVSWLQGSSLLDRPRRLIATVSGLRRTRQGRRSLAFVASMVLSGFLDGLQHGIMMAVVEAGVAAMTLVLFMVIADRLISTLTGNRSKG